MTPDTQDSVFGIKLMTVVLAFAGSALTLSYVAELSKKQAISGAITGTAVATMATPLAMYYLPIPHQLAGSVAFFLGLVAMRTVPVLFTLIDRLKYIKLPWVADANQPPEEPKP